MQLTLLAGDASYIVLDPTRQSNQASSYDERGK